MSRSKLFLVFASAFLFWILPQLSWTLVRPPEGSVLPDYDIRRTGAEAGSPKPSKAVGLFENQLREAFLKNRMIASGNALEKLSRESLGTPVATWNPVNGSAKFVRSFDRPLTPPCPDDPAAVARRFIRDYKELFALDAGDLDSLELAARQTSHHNGMTYLIFQQKRNGIDVYQGYIQAAVASDGSVASIACGDLLPLSGFEPRATLGPEESLRTAASAVGVSYPEPVRLNSAAERIALFARGPFERGIDAEPVIFPTPTGPRIAWRMILVPKGYPACYQVIIDAGSGTLLMRHNLTKYAQTQGLVITQDPDKTPQAMVQFPDSSFFVDPSSPLGWVSTNLSLGNNVDAKEDHAGDDELTVGARSQASGTPLTFSDAFTNVWQTSGGVTLGDTAAAATNLFYFGNFLHDRLYKLGFDEAAANYQQDNLDKGGLPRDFIYADAQDAFDQGQRNNAFFSPLPDGNPGRTGIYLFEPATGFNVYADASFDGDVVYHELIHGASSRLVGGPAGQADCLPPGLPQSGAIGEGTSDFFPASIYNDPVMGEYVTGNPQTGIRNQALDTGTYTYSDLCTLSPIGCESHADGEIWAQTLWKARAAVIGLAGFPAGRDIFEQLVIDGMKFCPCAPSFLDFRDALLLADFYDTGGFYHCAIWQAFAAKGMGASATSDPSDQSLVTAASDLPPECTGTGAVRFSESSYACNDEGYLILTDTNASAPVSIEVTTANGDRETFSLLSGVAGAFTSAPFAIQEVAAPANIVTGNGILEVLPGDTLTATYNDANPSGKTSIAHADIVCTADLRIVRHYFKNSNCKNDGDTLPEFPELVGYLDAGEKADLMIEVVNEETFTIEDAILTASSDNPNVVVAPSSGYAVGKLEGMKGTSPNSAVVRFKVAASNNVNTGDTAHITIGLTGLGVHGTTTPIVLTLSLDNDYRLLSESFSETFETGSAANWIHGSTDTALPGDEWALITCDSHSPSHSYHNGGTDCSDYTDDQGNPYLASPVLQVSPPGTLATKLNDLTFYHEVDLAGGPPGLPWPFDADIVGLALSDADIANGNNVTVAVYGNIPAFGYDNNTNGAWVQQSFSIDNSQNSALDLQAGLRLMWVFLIDVIGPNPIGGDIVGNGYYVDDITMTWDRAVAQPQVNSCGNTCNAAAWAIARPLRVCQGDSPKLDGTQSIVADCMGGTLEYRWTDGAGWDTGFGPGNASVTPPAPAATTTYTLEVRCSANQTCTDSMGVTVTVGGPNTSPAPAAGNTLRVVKAAAGGIHLDWSGATTTPQYFNIHHTSSKFNLADTSAAIGQTAAIPVDSVKAKDISNPQDIFYEVWPRNPCTDVSVVP